MEWRKSTNKDLRRITAVEVRKIVTAVAALAHDPQPQGCKKMQGSDCAYRIRVTASLKSLRWLSLDACWRLRSITSHPKP